MFYKSTLQYYIKLIDFHAPGLTKYTFKCLIRFIVLLILWLLFAYYYYADCRHSLYYKYRNNDAALRNNLNNQLQESTNYFNELINKYKVNIPKFTKDYKEIRDLNPDYRYYNKREQDDFYSSLCVVILTTNRDIPILKQTLSSLVLSMNKQQKSALTINIMNTSNNHTVINELKKAKIPYINILDFNTIPINDLPTDLQNWNPYENDIRLFSEPDPGIFINMLAQIKAMSPSVCNKPDYNYALILEDDILFTQDFFTKVKNIVDTVNFNRYNDYNVNRSNNWAWIKLFTPDYLDGFEKADIPLLLLYSILVSLIFNSIFYIWDKYIMKNHPTSIIINIYNNNNIDKTDHKYLTNIRQYKKQKALQYYYTVYTLVFILYTVCILLIFASIAKQNLPYLFGRNVINGITLVDNATPSIQAQLYPLHMLVEIRWFLTHQLTESIRNTNYNNYNLLIHPADVTLMRFFNAYNNIQKYIQYRAIPDLVQHMGIISTSKQKNMEKQGKFQYLLQSNSFTEPANQFDQFDPVDT